MMNKTSLSMRDLHPTKSRPACLKDFELIFGMKYGMAAAKQAAGQEIHGVVHRITKKELGILDKIETWYIREKVEIFAYEGLMPRNSQGTEAYVYVFNPEFVRKDPDLFQEHPPNARYIEILIEGAKVHGVEKDYVSKTLESIQCIPRKTKSELKTLKQHKKERSKEPTILPSWSMEELKQKDDENPDTVVLALNQNILQLDISEPCAHREILQTNRGTQLAFVIAGTWIYEPKFGVPASYEDMSMDHCGAVEDWFIEFFLVGDMAESWDIVAQLS